MAHRLDASDGSARRILGVDPGLERTGYAVIETSPLRAIDAGVVRSDASMPLERRLCEIDAGLAEILDEHEVDLVAVEALYAHYKHPRTAIMMGHARGVILLAAARANVRVLSLPATKIKKTLTGNGHAGKRQMQQAIAHVLGLGALPEPADVADALAIAVCAEVTQRDEAAMAAGGGR
ncbi:MAG: crossover junction endodeoxyribonuclease RuvC [Phycisphaerales bacterium]|nr:crossover junction endodeoxyribonuclease RuvC [Phycisphaerales bacterium]MCB9856235.1 crossover junction endodeoxyribonuclease RuvC [Phycisphaerales bacterium]MCB9863326.1 crossover junction endodeoxyribonuclease RuvC [Phycisphaerales bacterium]